MVQPVHEVNGGGITNSQRESMLRRAAKPAASVAIVAAVVMAFNSCRENSDDEIRRIVPVAKEATELTVGKGEDGKRGAFVILPGGTLVTPVGLEVVKTGLKACIGRPVGTEQSTNFDTPDDFIPEKCARQITVPAGTADPVRVELPGNSLDRGISLYISTDPLNGDGIQADIRATIGSSDKK